MSYELLIQAIDDLEASSLAIYKEAKIRKLPDGKYRVLSEKGKNLGTYKSRDLAKKRLRQVEFFKHLDHNNSDEAVIDLRDADELCYSAIMRKLNEKASHEQVISFMKIYKKQFDNAVKDRLNRPEKIALQKTLVLFNKICPIKLDKKLVKSAALSELGNADQVGKYLADIVRFILNRISPENRDKSLNNLKHKFMNLDPVELSQKHIPASSSLGQAISFVKHVLFNHDAAYVKSVIDSLSRHL